MNRRDWLRGAVALTLGHRIGLAAAASPASHLAAAWDDAGGRHFVGMLEASAAGVAVLASIEVPTRAHGLLHEADGHVMAVARRPGEWLLRWSPGEQRAQWLWSEPDRRFTGHMLDDRMRQRWLTVESDLSSGAGLLVVRDRTTLAVIAEWQTGGVDPHEVLWDADGSLLIANGGVPTLPESGRGRLASSRADSSLARLDPFSGRRLGEWRLDDPWLSLRHLARHENGAIGIALQAEHMDPAERAAAPVLAAFDGSRLLARADQPRLAGYGGSVIAHAAGFAVSCPRADSIALFDASGRCTGIEAQAGVCALARIGERLWSGGSAAVVARPDSGTALSIAGAGLRFDNHWAAA